MTNHPFDLSTFLAKIRAEATAAGFIVGALEVDTPSFKRVRIQGDAQFEWNGSYVIRTGEYPVALFRNWHAAASSPWLKIFPDAAASSSLSPEEAAKRAASIASLQKALEERREEKRKEKLRLLTAVIGGMRKVSSHDYLSSKLIPPAAGLGIAAPADVNALLGSSEIKSSALLIPRYALEDDSLAGAELIFRSSRNHEAFDKRAICSVANTYFSISGEKGNKTVVICEGYATGQSIHERTGATVYCAFGATNLLPLAKKLALRGKTASAHLIIAADNDNYSHDGKARPDNPGVKHAAVAAKAANCKMVVPSWPDAEYKAPCDFSDLYMAEERGQIQGRIKELFSLAIQKPRAELPPLIAQFYQSGAGLYKQLYDSKGQPKESLFLASPFEVVAHTTNMDGASPGILCRSPDTGIFAHLLESGLMEGVGSLRPLSDCGVKINPGQASTTELRRYLTFVPAEKTLIITPRTGWVEDSTFVFPQTITPGLDKEYFFAGRRPYLNKKGTLRAWQQTVGCYAEGNSRLVLSIGEAFGACLRGYLGVDKACGWHIVGNSNSGKTICIAAGASTYGAGSQMDHFVKGALETWNTTGNSLEDTATSHNHFCLYLDEIGECNPQDIKKSTYSLINGNGKRRLSAASDAIEPRQWSIGLVSCGEDSMASVIQKAEGKINVGQELRICDLLAPEGHDENIFEDIHGFASSGEFAESLKEACMENYGHAFPAFVENLSTNGVSPQAKSFYLGTSGLTFFGVSRSSPAAQQFVAKCLSYTRLAISLAIDWGILPWDKGKADMALRTCFSSWLEGSSSKVRAGEQQHIFDIWQEIMFESRSLFQEIEELDTLEAIPDREKTMGFYKSEKGEWWIRSLKFKRICEERFGGRARYVAQVLKAEGFLKEYVEPISGRKIMTHPSPKQKITTERFYLWVWPGGDIQPLEPDSFPEPDENMDDVPF
ncbi:MAG: DUF927 domain-containing protein [Firmicutes bacterium]|nr:DUF927 domain-containing protein [Bacillota bacterium]